MKSCQSATLYTWTGAVGGTFESLSFFQSICGSMAETPGRQAETSVAGVEKGKRIPGLQEPDW